MKIFILLCILIYGFTLEVVEVWLVGKWCPKNQDIWRHFVHTVLAVLLRLIYHSEQVLQCTYLLSLDVLKKIVVAILLLARLTVLALKFNPVDVQKIMWKPHVICNHQSDRSISSFKPNNSGWQKVHLVAVKQSHLCYKFYLLYSPSYQETRVCYP